MFVLPFRQLAKALFQFLEGIAVSRRHTSQINLGNPQLGIGLQVSVKEVLGVCIPIYAKALGNKEIGFDFIGLESFCTIERVARGRLELVLGTNADRVFHLLKPNHGQGFSGRRNAARTPSNATKL
jgi:hypothetical protein